MGLPSDMEEKLVSDVDDETALKLLMHTQDASKFFCGFSQVAAVTAVTAETAVSAVTAVTVAADLHVLLRHITVM